MSDFGFLNINKPPDCTSHDVIAILRKSLEIKKIGHCGTLDPFATGVLVVGINDATRLFEYLPSDKVYLAEITFGIETETDDITGKVISGDAINRVPTSSKIPTLDEIKEKLLNFTGKIKQKPPIFSAVKINGNRAYKLARKNQIVLDDIKEKEIEIYSIEIVSYNDAVAYRNKPLQLKIHCSSGTYIRSIARDLGKKLNTCATLSSLKRIKVGNFFTIEHSINLKSITKLTLHEHLILPISILEIPKIKLEPEQIKDICHGRSINIGSCPLETPKTIKNASLMDNNDRLIAIGTSCGNGIIKPEKVFLKNG